MTLVVNASLVVAARLDPGPVETWAERVLVSEPLAAPHLLLVDTASILRRSALEGDVPSEVASMAHQDLVYLRVTLFPYPPLAARVWELRRNETAYDACYVALAESLDARLATLDVRLSQVTGLRCEFLTDPG